MQTFTVPLSEIGPKYEWVVFKANIYQFDFPIHLAGLPNGPQLTFSLTQPVYAVMTPEFLVDDDHPLEPHVIGRYGYGYSVVPDPMYRTVFAAGPSQITNTIETLTFRVMDTGEVRAHMDFITPQPPRIINFDPVRLMFDVADRFSFGVASTVLSPLKSLLENIEPNIDPIYFAVSTLNILTAGFAGEQFEFTRRRLFKILMNLHFSDVYKMFDVAGAHFAMVNNWSDEANLPGWAKRGTFTPAIAANAG
jgi:hypothetical protein